MTQITLELDDEIVKKAEAYSRRVGRPVAQVVVELIENAPQQVYVKSIFASIETRLSPLEVKVFSLVLKGFDQSSIATSLNLRLSQVSRHVQDIRLAILGVLAERLPGGEASVDSASDLEPVPSLRTAEEIPGLTPIVRSLIGVLKGSDLTEGDYLRHLEAKHL